MKLVKDTESKILDAKSVSDKEAEEAFKTILTWLGEDPNREGLLETPKRVIKSFNEFYAGYSQDPEVILSKTFEDIEGYNDIVLLKNINFETYHNDFPFNPSALSLYKWAPISDELKSLDRKIVLNSMILKWDIITKEFESLIQF